MGKDYVSGKTRIESVSAVFVKAFHTLLFKIYIFFVFKKMQININLMKKNIFK